MFVWDYGKEIQIDDNKVDVKQPWEEYDSPDDSDEPNQGLSKEMKGAAERLGLTQKTWNLDTLTKEEWNLYGAEFPTEPKKVDDLKTLGYTEMNWPNLTKVNDVSDSTLASDPHPSSRLHSLIMACACLVENTCRGLEN